MAHLPTHRGFKNFTGFLTGSQSYTATQRWRDGAPYNGTTYSTNLFGHDTLATVDAHDPALPLFLYLPWQAVHAPYDPVPMWDKGTNYEGMLWLSDCYVGRLRAMLVTKGMYDNTLIVYSSDNGGRGDGINYPLRGEKRTNYEGGMRVAAFVSGGLIPRHLRGTTSGIRFHIVDWYPTFCHLAGVDPSDNSPIPPLPIDPADPTRDIYGNATWPGIDGVNVWDALINPASYNATSIHHTIVLSREALIKGKYKIMTAQRGNTGKTPLLSLVSPPHTHTVHQYCTRTHDMYALCVMGSRTLLCASPKDGPSLPPTPLPWAAFRLILAVHCVLDQIRRAPGCSSARRGWKSCLWLP